MENSKTLAEAEKRAERSLEIEIKFTDSTLTAFQVIATKDEFDKKTGSRLFAAGESKYDGCIVGDTPHKDDSCKCPSFTNNNAPKGAGLYWETHGFAFQCKHLIAARHDRLDKLQVAKFEANLKQESAS